MFFQKIRLLFWKNIRLRQRKWFLTFCEFVLPLLMFYILAKFNTLFSDVAPHKQNETVFPSIDEQGIYFKTKVALESVKLYYTPSNKFTNDLIGGARRDIGVIINPVQNETAMRSVIRDLFVDSQFHRGVGIVFSDVTEGDTVPKNLNYKFLDTYGYYHTDSLFGNNPYGQGINDAYLEEGIIGLQLAIDKMFISMKKNFTSSSFTIQPYPYPAVTYSAKEDMYSSVFPAFMLFSFSLLIMSVLKNVVEEKYTGVKELQKLMGLDGWMVWAGWLMNALMVYLITIFCITILLTKPLNSDSPAVFAYSESTVIFLFILLYCIGSVFFCFAMSTLFKRPSYALTLGLCIWYGSMVMTNTIKLETLPFILKILVLLIPNAAMQFGCAALINLESQAVGAHWALLFNPNVTGSGVSLGLIMCMFIVECFFYAILTWYIDSLFPGKYGISKPFYFPFTYLCPTAKDDGSGTEMMSGDDAKYFEKVPDNLEVGMEMRNLRKSFGNFEAVKGINLKILKGEITALLGHNGAGKTTTMTMLAGMMSPTYGSIYYEGRDIFKNLGKFRHNIGMCTQHNLHFSYLTVLEHLLFFGMLKGHPYDQVHKESMELLTMLNIVEKRNSLVFKISGGMKRKLSLAIALVGKPKILMLDEPTSGMDVESRRGVWDLLLQMRGDRTILLTTHYMEEADALGDRIAIMDHGLISCHGTTMFLKNAFGTGYNVTLLRKSNSNIHLVTNLIKKHVPEGMEVQSVTDSEIVYSIPSSYSSVFPDMFAEIEHEMVNLGIEGIGMSYTTMEEVFIKAGKLSELNKDLGISKTDHHSNISEDVVETENLLQQKVSGTSLLLQQFNALSIKKIRFTYRKWALFIICSLSPIVTALYAVSTSNRIIIGDHSLPVIQFSVSVYEDAKIPVYAAQDTASSALMKNYEKYLQEQYTTVLPIDGTNMTDFLLRFGKKDLTSYRYNVLGAVEFSFSRHNLLYNTIAYHSLAAMVNSYTVAILRTVTGSIDAVIKTFLEPFNIEQHSTCPFTDVGPIYGEWAFVFLGFCGFTTYFITLPHLERVSGIRHIQFMSKLSPIMYWFTMAFIDLLYYIIIAIIALLGMKIIDRVGFFSATDDLLVLFAILVLYALSGITFNYMCSYKGETYNTSLLLCYSVTVILCLMIMPIFIVYKRLYMILPDEKITVNWKIWYYAGHTLYLIPSYNFLSALVDYTSIVINNRRCMFCAEAEIANCEANTVHFDFFTFPSVDNQHQYVPGLMLSVVFFVVTAIVYPLILIFISYNVSSKFWVWLINLLWGSDIQLRTEYEEEDIDVKNERDQVNTAQTSNNAALVVSRLVKNYSSLLGKRFTAVGGVSFTVNPGECFGLLGVNGAGKSTTFKMLTADIVPTSGDATISGYSLLRNEDQYLSKVGYCPQENAIIEELTGKEMLELLCLLRGVHPADVDKCTKKWIATLGLEEYHNKRCKTYSGGNKRKLCTAVSLIGDPNVVFLDEPTSGVDPVSRRNLYAVMKSSKKIDQAVVLTSHSMEECEILCDRLTIMAVGQMKCIGSVQYLKHRYAQGFTVVMKLKENLNDDNTLPLLKQDMKVYFKSDCALKDEHKGLLHYHITNTSIKVSELFRTMERLKQNHELISDYTISDTTLEQIFISFAKKYETI